MKDPIVYPDPETFKPERFLINGKFNVNFEGTRDPEEIVFGYGRR